MTDATVVECIPHAGTGLVLVEVTDVSDGVISGYRVRRSDLTRVRRAYRTRRGATLSTGSRLVTLSCSVDNITRVIHGSLTINGDCHD